MKLIKDFYTKLKETADTTIVDIHGAKTKLHTEIQHIGDLKVTTQTTKFKVTKFDVRNMQTQITPAINNLIQGCKNYRKRHQQRN